MQCDQAADIDECLSAGTVKCGAQEQCFLEKVTTKNLNFVYNAGCRSALVCNIMASLGGGNGRRDLSRPSRELVNCAQCCNTAPGVATKGSCNSELCGARPSVDNSIRCFACDNLVSGSAACSQKSVCTDTEVCATSIHILGGNLIKYDFRCEEKHFCEAMIQNGIQNRASQAGGVKICDACCKDSECNKKDCFQLRKTMATQFANVTATTTAPKPATAVPTTKPTTPAATTTKPTTPIPTTTKPTTPIPTTPVPTTTKPTTPIPTTPVPTTPVPTSTTPVPTTPVPTTKLTQPPSNKPSSPVPSSGSSRKPSTFAPNFTVI
ncbi:hypothetical protein KP79_PYT17473 [Mizuhopecten yessoensis]|uniref:Uncharacterized protein n=2 Tax=Mizuhopecten yessoensis TaxID=6573 RepID=A0A210QLB9_MIZYE|nr:hypothetical protein KP79_PYT17473 [Mizuhopecten yessoensis]